MKASEYFLLVVLHAHIIAAAKAVCPALCVSRAGELCVCDVAEAVINQFISLDYSIQKNHSEDGVVSYACELLFLGMIWHGYHDAIREGDGNSVIIMPLHDVNSDRRSDDY